MFVEHKHITIYIYLLGAVSPTPIPPDELKRMEKSPDPSDRSRPSTADSKKGILRPSSRSSSGGRRSRSNSGRHDSFMQMNLLQHVPVKYIF